MEAVVAKNLQDFLRGRRENRDSGGLRPHAVDNRGCVHFGQSPRDAATQMIDANRSYGVNGGKRG